jgi:CDGSH-type Zn-finger protein
MLMFRQSTFKLLKKEYCLFKNSSLLKLQKFSFSEENKDSNSNKDETIDISKSKEVDAERVISISDVYTIKSNKMAPKNIANFIDKSRFENNNVKLRNYSEKEFKESGREEDRKYIPISPRLGPFEILEPKMEGKTYHWCSCGMSKKQPFCDGSHKNTKFKPISFKIGEKVDSMLLCGCKLSKLAPFCDRKTCLTLKMNEEEEVQQIIKNDSK